MKEEKPPIHMSEAQFRRYEKTIFRALAEYPRPVSFNPAPLSVNTAAARLRDAMASHIKYNWRSTVDPIRLAELRTQLHVKMVGGMVVLGPKDSGESISMEPKVEGGPQTFTLTLNDPIQLDLHAVAHLISRNIMHGPVEIRNPQKPHLDEVLERYNIHIREENGVYIML